MRARAEEVRDRRAVSAVMARWPFRISVTRLSHLQPARELRSAHVERFKVVREYFAGWMGVRAMFATSLMYHNLNVYGPEDPSGHSKHTRH